MLHNFFNILFILLYNFFVYLHFLPHPIILFSTTSLHISDRYIHTGSYFTFFVETNIDCSSYKQNKPYASTYLFFHQHLTHFSSTAHPQLHSPLPSSFNLNSSLLIRSSLILFPQSSFFASTVLPTSLPHH